MSTAWKLIKKTRHFFLRFDWLVLSNQDCEFINFHWISFFSQTYSCANQPLRRNCQIPLPWIISLTCREFSEDYNLWPTILSSIPWTQLRRKGYCLKLWKRIGHTTVGHFLIRLKRCVGESEKDKFHRRSTEISNRKLTKWLCPRILLKILGSLKGLLKSIAS